MRLLKRVLLVVATLLALAFILLHVGPDIHRPDYFHVLWTADHQDHAPRKTGESLPSWVRDVELRPALLLPYPPKGAVSPRKMD